MTTLNIHPSIHPTQRPGCKLCHYQSTARFGRENNNSKENRSKRAANGNGHKNGKGSLLDDVVIMVQGNISRRWFDAALRGIDFIGDTMRDDPQCEGACEYLWNLLASAQDAYAQQQASPAVQLDQARTELLALKEAYFPAPAFGTRERSEYDNDRRRRSENGQRVLSKAGLQARIEARIAGLEMEVENAS